MEIVENLRQYLENKFGNSLCVSCFTSGNSLLEEVNGTTDLVIMDMELAGEDGQHVFDSVKRISPTVEIIILTSNEDVSKAIELFRGGASNYIIKGKQAFKKVGSDVYDKLTAPLIRIGKELGLSKFVSLFLVTFILVGIVVVVLIQVLPK